MLNLMMLILEVRRVVRQQPETSVDPEVGDATGNIEADDTAGAASGLVIAGDDNVEGQKERWRAIDNARFVPDLDSKR